MTPQDVMKIVPERASQVCRLPLHRPRARNSTLASRSAQRRTSSKRPRFDGSSIAGWKGIRPPTCC